jgi:Cu2+-exporting ATPase
VGGHSYSVGSEALAGTHAELPADLHERAAMLAARGLSPVWVVRDGMAVAVLALGDRLRDDAGAALRRLKALGLSVELLSGDHPQAVEPVARELGIEVWQGRVSPEEKLQRVEALLAAGKRVAMVGDGVNDAAALSRATVGISAAGAAEVARDAADVFIATTRGPAAVAEAFGLSRRALRVIRWNLAIALAYNVVGVALAITGHVGPLVAAVLMPLSSLTVLLIATRA